MKRVKSLCALVLILTINLIPALSQAKKNEPISAEPLHSAHHALTSVIVHDIFSPPVSSRIYAYSHIAAYEILVLKDSSHRSLRTQIPNFPKIDAPSSDINYEAAAVSSFLFTAKRLVFSEEMMADSTGKILDFYKKLLPKKLYERSINYGQEVSRKIIEWSEGDGYAATRKMKRYTFARSEGKWTPTPPVYLSAVEPHWRLIRPFVLDSASQFKPSAPPDFSRDTTSLFNRMARYVYIVSQRLTDEQKAIANFWDCNPFAVNVHGHLNFATKKLSPGGHWLSIAGIASKKENAGMARSSAAYTLTAITLFDAFISCWDEKYRSNLIRPESYINAYIDENWKPMLQTPPFPEYTSGHSVISTASAVVLTAMFGESFSFVDTSEIEYGLPARTFKSFSEACDEAALSRLYGGIHYMPAIELGQMQGKSIGTLVLKKLSLSKSTSGLRHGSKVSSSSPGR